MLPSIQKTGRYDYCIDHKYNNTLTFKIENEMDLHVNIGEIHYHKGNKTNRGKQIEFSAENNQFEKKNQKWE